MITIQTLVIILSLAFAQYILYESSNQAIKVFDTTTMSLTQLTALAIFIESYHRHYIQKEFLRKINSIDFILKFKIGITADHIERSKINIKRLLQWMIVYVSVFIINIVVMKTDVWRWWIILYLSFFIYSLRYFQITTYVDILHHRYYQINQFIKNLQKTEEKMEINDFIYTETIFTLTQKYKSKCIYEKIRDLRQVFRLIYSANRSLNQMFRLSMPMIILNDFLHIMVNSYWFLMILLFKADSSIYLIGLSAWSLTIMNNLISLSEACHRTVKEVIFSNSINKNVFNHFNENILFRHNLCQFTCIN